VQGYSLNGYLNAILRRSGKTILVEGDSDRIVLSKLKHELVKPEFEPAIDCIKLISNEPSLSTLGNKAKILKIIEAANELTKAEDILNKLSALVDREWDYVNQDAFDRNELNSPPHQQSLFFTHGHSIENYSFHYEFIKDFMVLQYSEVLPQSFFQTLAIRFGAVVCFAYAYSHTLRNLNVISRSEGLLAYDDLNWVDESYQLNESFINKASLRTINIGLEELAEINSIASNKENITLFGDLYRLLSHGHLGSEAIWCCVANLIFSSISCPRTAKEVERGHRDSKLRFASDFISRKLTPPQRSPLDNLIGWLA